MRWLEEACRDIVEYLLDRYTAEQFYAAARWSMLVALVLYVLLVLHIAFLRSQLQGLRPHLLQVHWRSLVTRSC